MVAPIVFAVGAAAAVATAPVSGPVLALTFGGFVLIGMGFLVELDRQQGKKYGLYEKKK